MVGGSTGTETTGAVSGTGRGGRGVGHRVDDHRRIGRRRAGEEVLEFAVEGGLGPSGLDPGAPELIGDETEHEQACCDQCLADPADPPPPVRAEAVGGRTCGLGRVRTEGRR